MFDLNVVFIENVKLLVVNRHHKFVKLVPISWQLARSRENVANSSS